MIEIPYKIESDIGVLMLDKYYRYYRKYKGKHQPAHRVVYEKYYGSIPEGYEVHHLDGNRFNNHINNLVAVTTEEHRKIHKNWQPHIKFKIVREVRKETLLEFEDKNLSDEFIGYDEVTLFGVKMKLK